MKRHLFARLSASLLTLLSPFAISSALHAQDGGGAAAAAAPAAVSAPAAAAPAASAASAAASTGSSASTGSTESVQGSANGTGGGPLQPNPGESDAAYLQRVMTSKGGLTAEAAEDAEDTEDADDFTPTPGEGNDTPAEDTPGEDADAEDTPAGAGEEEDYDPYVAPGVLLAPKDLATKINANPELKAVLDKDPDLKRTLLDQSRNAAENQEFKKVFTSADEAKAAAAGNREYNTLADLVTSINKAEDAQGFYTHLLQLSVLHDDDGNPIMKDGKPVSDGTVGRLIHHTGELFLNHFEGLSKAGQGDEELAAAVEILKDRAFGNKGKDANADDLTEAQRAKATELETREKTLRDQETANETKAQTEYENNVVTGIDTYADTTIDGLLKRTDIAGEKQGGVKSKIREAAYNLIVENPQFKMEQDALMRRARGPKTLEARVALGKKWLGTALPIVAPKIIADEGAKIMSRQSAQQKRQQEKQDASRSEGAGQLRTAKPVNKSSAADLTNSVISEFTAKHNRAPNSSEIFAGIIKARTGK